MKITKTKLRQIIREELEWWGPERPGYGTAADAEGAGTAVGADRHLAYMMENLGTLDNVAQVLELVAEEMPEFMQTFQNYYDQLID